MSEAKEVKLSSGLPHTASWARLAEDGSLIVELYDFSPDAEKWFGNDVAFLLHVRPRDKKRVLAQLLREQAGADADDHADADATLLRLVHERFADYYAVKEWLDRNGVVYDKEFEPWA